VKPYAHYLTVDTDAVAVNAFLEVVGGDTVVATVAGGETLVARGMTDGSGNLTLRWGAQDIENAPASSGIDEIQDNADQAAAEADGWTFTNTASPSTGNVFLFNQSDDVGPYSNSFVLKTHNNGYYVQTGSLKAEKTFTVVNGQSYRVKVWAGSTTGNAWYSALSLTVISGANSRHTDINGTEADQQLDSASITADGTSLLVRLSVNSGNTYALNQLWPLAHLTVDGISGGGANLTFREIPACLGSGTGQSGDVEPEPMKRAA
jgi:hypothetical protein